MLSQDSRHHAATKTQSANHQDEDIIALRAAYQAVVTASAHSVWSGTVFPQSGMQSEPLMNAYQAAVAAFANSIFTNSANAQTTAKPTVSMSAATDSIASADPEPARCGSDPPYSSEQQHKPAQANPRLAANQQSQWVDVPRRKAEQTTTQSGSAHPAENRTASRSMTEQPVHFTQKMNPTHPIQSGAATRRNSEPIGLGALSQMTSVPQTAHAAGHSESMAQDAAASTMDFLFEDLGPMPSYQTSNGWTGSMMESLMNRPKLVTGLIGLCVLASSIYAGLGYWWLNITDVSQAAETVNSQPHAKSGSQFGNLEALQNQGQIVVPDESRQDTPTILLAQAQPKTIATKTYTMRELESIATEPTGRPDPFEPLIMETGAPMADSLLEDEKNRDVLESVQYTGFIGDVNSKDKLAIIKIADPAGGEKTLIKKAGDSFMVDGERVNLRAIAKQTLQVTVQGKKRSLTLSPFADVSNYSAKGNGSGTQNATGAGGNSPSTGSGNFSGSGNSTSPRLQEPSGSPVERAL